MKFQNTNIKDCEIINYQSFPDNRGFFSTPYNLYQINDGLLMDVDFIQDNVSYSKKNVIRGLHFQTGEFEQAKLVNCFWGRIIDVVVDIRKDSPTYGQWEKFLLTEDNFNMVWIPGGFAHGFLSLEDDTHLIYKTSGLYNKEADGSINPLCDTLNIDWEVEKDNLILSEKDRQAQSFLNYKVDPKF